MTTFLVPAGSGEGEFTEKRSRFIGHVWRVESEAEAGERIRETREIHRDATHNVYAYIIREGNIVRFSDDGEPGGTSGMPTLNVFSSEKIENVCCVVTRYFGGTLLGAGGLVRAYSKAAKLALDAAGVAQMAQWLSFKISFDYSFFERAKRILDEFEALTTSSDFGTEVSLEALVREDRALELERSFREASAGKALWLGLGSEFRAGPRQK
ncbi:MAG: YigZ family protein [Oscillospiraceae bacterium]